MGLSAEEPGQEVEVPLVVEKGIGEEETAVLQPKKKSAFDSEYVEQFLSAKKGDLQSSLKQSRGNFLSRFREILLGRSAVDETLFSELEELLLASDIGIKTTQELIAELKVYIASHKNLTGKDYLSFISGKIEEILSSPSPSSFVSISPEKVDGKPRIVILVGVNGTGKTTTIAKIAHRLKESGAKVLVAACDTFRAAAPEQLSFWAEVIGVDIEKGKESDKPSTVAYNAVHRAQKEDYDVLLIDTAGRLHTKNNLMAETFSVSSIVSREQPGSPHDVILVVDGSSGQNALQQAREFEDTVSLSGVIVTKLDGSPKGGIVVAIKKELNIPIRYIGVGERAGDLLEFSAKNFTEAF